MNMEREAATIKPNAGEEKTKVGSEKTNVGEEKPKYGSEKTKTGEETLGALKKKPNAVKIKRKMAGIKRAAPSALLLLGLAAVWEAGTRLLNVPHYIIPSLSSVLASLWENRALLTGHFGVTLRESLIGLGFSIVLGVLSAVWIESSKFAKQAVYPLLIASQTVPIIALSPIMVMWFGYELWSKVAVVVLFSFFPIAVNTADGFKDADPGIGELLQTMGAGKKELLLKWKLPSALPGFFTGFKMAAALSVAGATLGEWLGGESGLGMYTKRSSNMLRGADVFASVLLLSAMGILLFLAAALLESAALRRRRQAGRNSGQSKAANG